MLEGLAAWVLNTYVGGYVENLNTHQLSIGLLRGQVELENLPLKKDAFRHLLLPLEIKAGFIGKLSLKIPVTRLRSEPWLITIEQLYVIIGPVSLNDYDEEREEQVLQNAKVAKLDAMEAKWKASYESKQEPSYYAYSYAAWLTCGTSVMSNIIKNLQFKIKDIHIRFEDGCTDPQNPFACGITIQTLSSQAAAADDAAQPPPSASEAADDVAHQSLQLSGFASYWDSDVTLLGGLDIMAMAEAMKKQQTHALSSARAVRPHTYLLATTSFQAQISRNCSPQPLRLRSKPRLTCNLQLDKFSLTLNEEQYRQMVFCLKELERTNVSWKYRRWRPAAAVRGNARQWWQFAVQAHVNHLTKKRSQATWEFALKRAKQVKTYVDTYYCHLTKPECLTAEMQKEKNLLEKQLELETLLSLRELVIQKVRREQESWPVGSGGQGILQYWFPGWTGWYTKQEEAPQPPSADVTEDEASDIDDASSISTSLTTQIEEEILDALDSVDRDTFLMRDTVLARVCFSLSQCGLTLVGRHRTAPTVGSGDDAMQPLVELRFTDVTVDVESRPRLGSFLFAARLGSLHLQDRTAHNTAYPYVLSPHTVVESVHIFPPKPPPVAEGAKGQPSIFKFLPFTSPSAAPFGIPLMQGQKMDVPSVPLFELTYERKPLSSNADHSLTVNTQSLDVVYNPSTIRTVKKFFTLFNYEGGCSQTSSVGPLNLSAAARSRYEMFKRHTKEELRHRWDLMLEGEESNLQVAKWDIHMDICAPQIIVPESFTDHNSLTVLIDLGRVQFSNSSVPSGVSHSNVDDISDDEADFKTPCTSPPELEELVNEPVVLSPVQETAFTDADVCDRMYKKYTLNLQDMQVLIGTSKDSWKFAQSKGTSRMHVLDRFSISVQVERRLLATDDPHWPSVILNMKLPRLTAHVNEQKVHAMQMCLSRLRESTSTRPPSWSSQGLSSPCPSSEDFSKAYELGGMSGSPFSNRAKEPHEMSLLLLAQCSIEQMCLEVQSRGRCIAELQVTGIQVTFSKMPLDSSITMSVHGLLLVDALQTYGPDFELLVASHRHVSMDSRSGSIRDSDPNSPTSPATPPLFALQPAPPLQTIAVPKVLSAILSTLQSASPKVLTDRQRASPIGILDAHEADALITAEISIVNVPSSSTNGAAEQVFIAAVQFNNLDVIANQETIVELVNFARCLKPCETLTGPLKTVSREGRLSTSSQFDLSPSSVQALPNQINSMQLTFDFHRFNVLLLRAVSKKGSVSGQKVATATVSGARIQASIGSSLEIQGTLGGLQVCDLISEKTLHRRIVSMGSGPHLAQDNMLAKHHASLYRSLPLPDSGTAGAEKAFEFTVKRYRAQGKQAESECLEVVARMASVCYIHSPLLLHELASCAVEFKHCVSMLAQSIKNAATEVALGIVNLPAQTVALSFHVCPPDGATTTTPVIQRELSLNESADAHAALPLDVKLDILLQTPVIVLPCNASSRDVVVAHLGRISVQNTNSSVLQSDQFAFNSCDPHKSGLFFVQFRDVNLYSLNIDENLAAVASGKPPAVGSLPLPDSLPVVDLYSCRAHGRPILHDTIIEFTVQYKQPRDELEGAWFTDGASWIGEQGDQGDQSEASPQQKGQPTLEVSGTVINVLKFAVTKHQYELLLQSTKNITYCKETAAEEEEVGEPLHFCSSWDDFAVKDLLAEQNRPQQSLTSMADDISKQMAFNCHVNFVLPEFIVNICSELCNDKQDLVALSFQEFVVNYERNSPYETTIQLALKGVVMEDLMEGPESSHRYLIRSSNPESQTGDSKDDRPPKSDFISFSCPDMKYHVPTMAAHPSLPDRLCTQNVFQAHLKKSRATEHPKKRGQCSSTCDSPSTPPPSPSGSMSPVLAQEDSLMHINVLLIDSRCPDFASKHNRVSQTVTVELNSLETMINAQTWVMVLDFLGLAADLPEEPRVASRQDLLLMEDADAVKEPPGVEVDNTELEVNIHNFVVTLNKPAYELARASISGFTSHLSLRDSNIAFQASLGKICVLDLTGHGHLYRERFITAGPEALHFNIFKYGSPDPDLKRDCDVKVKCEMSSVQVVHTQRFLTEVTDFFADFSELQMLLKAATAGNKMNLSACRAPRVQLEVTAASPVIVVPQSYRSLDVLVANLGNLNISTTFRFTGEGKSEPSSRRTSLETSLLEPARKGCTVISAEEVMNALVDLDDDKCLLQAMDVELVDMDVYSGVCVPTSQAIPQKHPEGSYTLQFPSIFIKKNGGPLLKQTLMLRLLVEKNLDCAFNHSVPDWTVEGSFSSVHVTLDRSQYALVHGILSRNLAEKVERSSASNLTLLELFPEQHGSGSDNSWTFLAIRMALVNVTLELVHAHARPLCANAESTLAKVELIRSRLTLERFSDQSNDIDLVSHEIRILDTRFKDAPVNNRPNVFTNILQPTKNASREKVLQAEIHYRVTHNTARFTVLLNNMRVMAIFSWISELAEFLSVGTEGQVFTEVKHATGTDSHQAYNQGSGRRMTKQWQQQQPIPEVPLELKLNMTDTEIVVVEDAAAWDTNAVILKSTAVLSYHGAVGEKPLSCNLQNLEVFSCILGLEDDTALSIVDPISVYIDLVAREPTSFGARSGHVLQVGTLNLNLRLSYNDVKMFLRILDSIPKQLLFSVNKTDSVNIDSLLEMGFSREDCLRSLEACKGNVDDAALWLTRNAAPCSSALLIPGAGAPTSAVKPEDVVVSAVELKVSYFCLCIIDDCMDADVPLLEIDLRETYISQELSKTFSGESKFFFSTGYYNRALSGWEPIIEPWRCHCQWEAAFGKAGLSKFHFKINAEDVLKVNITTALLDLYQKVKKSWAADFYQLFSAEKSLDNRDATMQVDAPVRRRSPFVPFAIKNDLGVAFRFTAFVSAAFGGSKEEPSTSKFDWKDVEPGQVVPFTFQGRGKIRHQDSHELRMHKLVVKIAGYSQLDPVSVEKVGVYFKYAVPVDRQHRASSMTRVVFSVTLDGNARKLITVRSALVVKNKVEVPVDLKLETTGVRPYQICLQPKCMAAVPLPYVFADMWVRPTISLIAYSSLEWQHFASRQQGASYSITCCPIRNDASIFRFSVDVKRENYPDSKSVSASVPGHTISLLPPLSIHNLLPYELAYVVNEGQCKGIIPAQKNRLLHEVNTEQYVIVGFSLENFRLCTSLVIPPGSSTFSTRLETHDTEGRLLVLHARVSVLRGRALKVFVSVPYWMINRSGLPLIFKQEGTNSESAGQFREHEQARSVAPLLFSFSDSEASMMCSMRVGTELHPRSFPQWCTCFSLEKGIKVRRLMVSPNDARPDWVYTIGVEIRQGRGKYMCTNHVVLSPRFLIDNQSSAVVQIAQRFATKELQYRHHISLAKPKSSLPFHWPRVDLDNLLCVRLVDIAGCQWSGGFKIDELNSFHIHMRDDLGRSYFLRVEVILKGATFFIIFMDCAKIPPPLRIDNQSEVSVTFHQTSVANELLRATVRAHTSVPYAWDEPTLPPYITVTAPGGMSETYDMTLFRPGKKLYYENFFYIAFSGTFLEPRAMVKAQPGSKDVRCQELVLDVPQGSRVVINKKELGKRSQLWRMTSTGMLQHEGSSTPREPRPSAEPGRMLVLDIAGLGPEPKKYTELMLRKPDGRRRLTQTWQFRADGRLTCQLPGMFVQPRDGFAGLRRGNDVVLGPPQPVSFACMDNGVPVEQAVVNQKMRGGSGVLSVRVIPKGPTIVLCVSDFVQKQKLSMSTPSPDLQLLAEKGSEDTQAAQLEGRFGMDLELNVHLLGGLGVSVINHLSEELVYAVLQNIRVNFQQSPSSQILDASVENVQVDNQLHGAERPVALYVTPLHERDRQRHLPAVVVTAERLPQRDTDVVIFQHFIMHVKNLTVALEELLMLKVLQLLHHQVTDFSDEIIIDNQLQRAHAAASANARRFYFNTLKLRLDQVKLSVLTLSHRPPELDSIKKKAGWSLMRFEDVVVELDSFVKSHPFESLEFLVNNVIEHYRGEFQSHAAKILGAVDFLGDPVGLFNDVCTGWSESIKDGNITCLIKGVTHGLSNSTVKMAGSLSESLTTVANPGGRQLEQRSRSAAGPENSTEGHLVTGLRRLGSGVVGGLTSVARHSYHGVVNEGVQVGPLATRHG